jgi:hypothetical protein
MDADDAQSAGHRADLLVELAQRRVLGHLILVDCAAGNRPLTIASVHPLGSTRQEHGVIVAQEHARGTK